MNLDQFLEEYKRLDGCICSTVSCNSCHEGDLDCVGEDEKDWVCPFCGSSDLDFCGCEV